ncbi:hypothetical protein VIGAN_09160200, partial [Vigna angularis var. angularis]
RLFDKETAKNIFLKRKNLNYSFVLKPPKNYYKKKLIWGFVPKNWDVVARLNKNTIWGPGVNEKINENEQRGVYCIARRRRNRVTSTLRGYCTGYFCF